MCPYYFTILKSAKEIAVKNRAAAIQKASKEFDEEIAALDIAIRQLSGIPAKKAAPKKVAKKAPPKKAAPKKTDPKKVAKKITPKKAAKKVAPKKVAPKKDAPKKTVKKALPKKVAPKKVAKKTATPAAPGSYPKDGSNVEKLIFIIGQAKRFISMQEIAEVVKKLEPSAGTHTEISSRLGKHMGTFRKQGKIVSYPDKEIGNKVYYGLPEYMKEGKVVKEHEHISEPAATK